MFRAATHSDGTFTYTYDNVNELTNVGGSLALTYSFDKNGNRNMSGYTTGSDNELTAANGNTYAYDAEGNMTGETDSAHNVWTFAYDYRDRLTGFTEKSSGGAIIAQGTYAYDALDRRIETVESVSGGAATTTRMVYKGTSDTAYAEYSGTGTLQNRYLSGPSYIAAVDSLLARTSSGGTTAWYLTDQLGSVTDLISTSGGSLDHIKYDPFGNILSESNPSNGDQFKFQEMQWNATLGLSLDDRRYYIPSAGRFVSQDPVGFQAGVTDLYGFVSNDASNAIDPTGLEGILPALGQGVANVANGLTDVAIGFGNLMIAHNWLMAGLWAFRAPAMPAPDWSKGLLIDEHPDWHWWSKFIGGNSAAVLLMAGFMLPAAEGGSTGAAGVPVEGPTGAPPEPPTFWRTGNAKGPTWNLRPGKEYASPPAGSPPEIAPGEGPSVWAKPVKLGNPNKWYPYRGGDLPPGMELKPTPTTLSSPPIDPVTGEPVPHYVLTPTVGTGPVSLGQFLKWLQSLGPWGASPVVL